MLEKYKISPDTLEIILKKISEEKEKLKKTGIEIGESGGTNDFHDNFAFEQANRDYDLQSLVLSNLMLIAKRAELIDLEKSNSGIVSLGSKVLISFGENDNETVLLGSSIDVIHGKNPNIISDQSPLGKAILGRKENEEVLVETPEALTKVIILKIY